MTASIFANVDAGTIVMAVLAVIIALYLWYLNRKEKQAADDPCVKYAVLTEETLAALPDGEVVNAVAANLMGKQDKAHPDLSVILPQLSHGRCGVYSVWLMCHELEKRDLKAYFRSPYRRFAAFAADGFSLIGAEACAAAMTAACEQWEAQKAAKKEPPAWDQLTAQLRQAIRDEQPLSLCVTYIRDNTAEFTD